MPVGKQATTCRRIPRTSISVLQKTLRPRSQLHSTQENGGSMNVQYNNLEERMTKGVKMAKDHLPVQAAKWIYRILRKRLSDAGIFWIPYLILITLLYAGLYFYFRG